MLASDLAQVTASQKAKFEIRGKIVVGLTLAGTLVAIGRERPLVWALGLAENP